MNSAGCTFARRKKKRTGDNMEGYKQVIWRSSKKNSGIKWVGVKNGLSILC